MADLENAVTFILVPSLLWVALSKKASTTWVLAGWIAAGVGMTAVNKRVAGEFQATCFLVIFQMLIADGVILASSFSEMSFGSRYDLAKWMFVPLSFASILATGLWSLKEATMSTVLILRNVLPLMSFAAERWLMDASTTVSTITVLSMLTTLVGTLLYGCWNISVTPRGASLILLNDALMVFDKLLQRHLLQSLDFSVSLPLCMLLNNTVGILPILLVACVMGEFHQWPGAVMEASWAAWAKVLLSGMLGCSLGYLALQVQQLVTATTFLVLQNFSKVLVVCLGVLIFGDPISGISAVGCALSIMGSAWYSYVQVRALGCEKEPSSSSNSSMVFLRCKYLRVRVGLCARVPRCTAKL